MALRLVLAGAVTTLALAGPADAVAQPPKCKGGKVPVTVGKKTTCKPLAKALPKPKAVDIRLAHLQEVLKLDPAKALKGKKRKRVRTLQSGFGAAGKKMQKKLLSVLPKALVFIDRKGGARVSSLASGLAHSSAGCQAGPAGPTGQTGGASMGALGDNGGYVDASAGGGFRVRVTFVSCRGANNFRIPECPTANGSVDSTGTGEFRATVEIWEGDRLVSRNSSTFEDRAKTHGEVGPDAKLKFIDVEHTQEVFIVASGGIVIRGGVTRKVRISMPGGTYDPAAASVKYFGDSVASDTGGSAFASTAASALSAYQGAEPRWSTFNPSGGYCAEPVFTPDSNTLKLKKNDKKQLGIYAKAKQDGGRATGARWTLLNPVNADFVPASSESPAPSVSYTVTNSPKGGEVRVTVKFTSTAGVGEKTWTQPTETQAIEQIAGTFSQTTDNNGSVFTAAGNATFLRWTPAILSAPEGGFKLVNGLYTFTASGKSVGTPLCSQKGSGQFAVHKDSEFSVFSQGFKEEPPYEYNFSVSSDNSSSLPMITVQYYGCSGSATELEGDTYEYPAAMSVYTTEPRLSPDGTTFADTIVQSGPNYNVTTTWNFLGSE
jgi:hypothetical protein